MVGVIVPASLLLIVYGGLALIACRRPLLGRLAWREAVRRRGHTFLLVAGMMFGTAAILGMQGVGDSLQRITTDSITTAWGRTDITVSRRGEPFLRAAIKRPRAIGVLRALGFRPGQVVGGLLAEALVTATVGIVVGIGVGFGMGWAYVTASGTTQTSVDMSQVLIPAGLIYAAVLLVTAGPAIRASRMPASEALRIVG